MNLNYNVQKISALNPADLSTKISVGMIGGEIETNRIGWKNPSGDMITFDGRGSNAEYSSVAITQTSQANLNSNTNAVKIESMKRLIASPLMYGAVADGITVDTTAILTALIHNDVVDLCGLTYLVSAFVVTSGKTIKNGTLIMQSGALSALSIKKSCTVNGVTIVGNGTGTGIYVEPVSGTDYENAYFSIVNCEFYWCGSSVTVGSNYAIGGGVISSSYFYGSSVTGINLLELGEYVTISSNIMLENKTAIQVKGGNVNINGNNITGSSQDENTHAWSSDTSGIKILKGSNDAHGVISSNNINHCKLYGIWCDNINNANMQITTNNIIDSNIQIYNAGLIFTNNRITSSSFTFVGTLKGTKFVDTVLDPNPVITYIGVCDVAFCGVQTTSGTMPQFTDESLYNGVVSNRDRALPAIFDVDVDFITSFRGFLTTPTNTPDNSNGYINSEFGSVLSIVQEFHKANSNSFYRRVTDQLGVFQAWQQIF